MSAFVAHDGSWQAGSSASMWQCGTCLEWVVYGVHHTCPQVSFVTATGIDLTAEDRIASALERIASALETANAKENA